MSNNARLFLGLVIVAIGLFWGDIKEVVPNVIPDSRPLVQITKPPDKNIEKASSTAKLITDNNDKLKLCIFNNVFATRLLGYECTAQNLNDIYVLAAKKVFGDSLRGKYDGFSEGVSKLLVDTMGTDNHKLAEEEKKEIALDFTALSYLLSK